MIGDIKRLLAGEPFVPFTIHLTDGGVVRVPTLDHAIVFPSATRLMVTHDDDTWDLIPGFQISRVTVDSTPQVA